MIIDLFVYTHAFVGCGFEYRCGWHALMREKWARFQSLYILSLVRYTKSGGGGGGGAVHFWHKNTLSFLPTVIVLQSARNEVDVDVIW